MPNLQAALPSIVPYFLREDGLVRKQTISRVQREHPAVDREIGYFDLLAAIIHFIGSTFDRDVEETRMQYILS